MASSPQISAPSLTKGRFGLAAVAALVGCVACCAMPLLAAVGLGSALSALSSVFRPGHELLVGGAFFVITLGGAALWSRFKRGNDSGCGVSCRLDGSCCERGAARRAP